MKTYPTSDPKMEPKSIKKHSRNRCEKREKKGHRKTPQHLIVMVRTIAKPNHFKRHPAEWGARSKYTKRVMRGEYKVECKKWSAKRQVQGECRKTSADRQHTPGPKHARWLRPRADPSCKASPHRAGQGLWCWKGFGNEKCYLGNCSRTILH